MIAAISYNVFNAEEHLLASLRQVRAHAEHINIVAQYVSNQGQDCAPTLVPILKEARRQGLCDAVIEFTPDLTRRPQENELAKRNIGLGAARDAGATHFMTMDCDEYYVPDEFARARAFIDANGISASAVPSYLHLHRPIWRSSEPDTTFCSFLTAIDPTSVLSLKDPYPVLVDPKRRLHGDRDDLLVFPPDILAMRHMNLVRLDLASKLANSVNAKNAAFMASVAARCAAWRPLDVFHFPNKPAMDMIEVDDIFGIDALFANRWTPAHDLPGSAG